MNKKIFLIILLSIISLLPIFTSCKDNNKIIEVESIKITHNKKRIACGTKTQLEVKILPENATNKNVKWYLDDYNLASIDQNGLLTTFDREGILRIYCVSDNGVEGYLALQIMLYCVLPYTGIYEIDLNENKPIKDDNLIEFAKRYNNSVISNTKFLDIIKEENKDDLEFLDLLDELEESYFSDEIINNYAYIFLKVPNTYALPYKIDYFTFSPYAIQIRYVVGRCDTDYEMYYKDSDYLVFKILLNKELEVDFKIFVENDVLYTVTNMEVSVSNGTINSAGEIK